DARESATLDAADERVVRPGVRVDLTVLAEAEKCERQVVVADDDSPLDVDEAFERPRLPTRPLERPNVRRGHGPERAPAPTPRWATRRRRGRSDAGIRARARPASSCGSASSPRR